MTRTLTLTPRRLRRLDLLARGQGFAVRVERMDGAWGRVHHLVDGMYRDLADPAAGLCEGRLLELAPAIDVPEFHAAKRPEVDLRYVPGRRAYEWVVWHELGHLLNNYCALDVMTPGRVPLGEQQAWMRRVALVNEVLADRFAWQAMYPAEPMRLSDLGRTFAPRVADAMDAMVSVFGEAPRRKRPPLPTRSLSMVPKQHVDYGVPLARKIYREQVEKPLQAAYAAWVRGREELGLRVAEAA